MAPFSQFVNRLANYIANEVLIKGLANSRFFQRFAVRTDKSIQDLHKAGTETFNEAYTTAAEAAASQVSGETAAGGATTTKGQRPQPPLTGFNGFVSAFFKEIQKDLTGGGTAAKAIKK